MPKSEVEYSTEGITKVHGSFSERVWEVDEECWLMLEMMAGKDYWYTKINGVDVSTMSTPEILLYAKLLE